MDSELTIRHGKTSHSRSLELECPNKDKDFQKCTPSHSTTGHIMEETTEWRRRTLVPKILMNHNKIGSKFSVLVKIHNYVMQQAAREVIVQVAEG